MCYVSMVMDQYQPHIPRPNQWPSVQPWGPSTTAPIPAMPTPKEIADLRDLLDSFRQAVAAAQVFDRLTNQPDCVDPEKAKLEERVAELERRLDALAAGARGE